MHSETDTVLLERNIVSHDIYVYGLFYMGESLWNYQNRKQQEISYILYVNIIAIFSSQNRILFQNRKLSPMILCFYAC